MYILLLIPLLIIGSNAWKIIIYYRRTKHFRKVMARIVNTVVTTENPSSHPSWGFIYYFTPIIEFTTETGQKYTLEYTESNIDRPLYNIGEELEICYDPVEPRRFMIYNPKAEYLIAAIWILFGVGVFYLMFIFDSKSKPPL